MNKVYHLSHTDLDGYSCQYLTSKIYKNISFFNSGYGKQITETFDKILSEISSGDTLLITDLNLTLEQSYFIDQASKEKGFELLLLDHHGTGKPSAEKYDWYNLDESICATKITYIYLKERDEENVMNEATEYFVECVNAYDLYQEENPLFNYGKTINGLLMKHRNIFPKPLLDEERELLFRILRISGAFLFAGEGIVRTEEMIHSTLRTHLSEGVENPDDLPFDTLKSQFLYNPIVEKEMFDVIEIDGHKTEVYFEIYSIYQEFSHMRLKKSDVDIVLHIGNSGNISMRALTESEVRVDRIAQKYFGGGGHPKASGGSVDKGDLRKLTRENSLELILNTLSNQR